MSAQAGSSGNGRGGPPSASAARAGSPAVDAAVQTAAEANNDMAPALTVAAVEALQEQLQEELEHEEQEYGLGPLAMAMANAVADDALAHPAPAQQPAALAQPPPPPPPLDTGISAAVAALGRKRRRPGEELLLMEGARGGGSPTAGAGGGRAGQDAVTSEYAVEMLQIMRRLRDRGALCDVVVKCGEAEVRAHRLVLAAASEYFRACLTGPMQESEEKVICMSGVDEGALEELVRFAYCGRVTLTEETVLEVLVAANRLQMPQVVEQACDFLLQRMDSSNCLTILGIASTYSCASMRTRAEAFIHRHFESVYRGEEFLAMPFEQLVALLRSDSVSVASEETTFRAVARWVMHDPEARSQHILPLLCTVRLELVPTSFIADVIHQHPMLAQCPEAEKLLLKAYRWHSSARRDTRMDVWAFIRKQAVRPVIYAVGGDDGHDDHNPYSAVQYLDVQLGQWHRVAPLRQKRSVCGAAALGGKMYVVGGYNGERAVETVEEFDPASNSWRTVAPIAQRRCSCGCAVLGGQLYVVGGVCGPLALNEVERYDPVADAWARCPVMQEGRSGCGVAELGGLIYAVGGINGAGETVRTAECFDPRTQRWQTIQAMHEPRRSFGLASLDGLLYACGGNDGRNDAGSDLNSLEAYDPQTNRWRVLAPMRYARMYCSVAVLDGKLYAVGGLDGATTLDVVEVYDPRRNAWAEAAPKLDRRVCGCGLAVMDCVVVGGSAAMGAGRRRGQQGQGQGQLQLEETKDAEAPGAGVGVVGAGGAAAAGAVVNANVNVGPPAAVAPPVLPVPPVVPAVGAMDVVVAGAGPMGAGADGNA